MVTPEAALRLLLLSIIVPAGCAHAPAPEQAGVPGRVSLDLEVTEAHAVFSEMARQSGSSLVYCASWSRLVSVSLHDAAWRDAVEAVAKSCDFHVDWETPGIVLVTDR